MPGLSFDDEFPVPAQDDGGIAFPTDDDDDDGGIAFPTDDDDDDGGIAFPTDDDEEPLLATPPLAPSPRPSPTKGSPAPRLTPPPKPAPPPGPAAPPRPAPRPVAPPKTRPITAPRPPSLGGAAPPYPRRPPAAGATPPLSTQPTPPPPAIDPFESGVFSGDSAIMSTQSGVMADESGVMAGESGVMSDESGVMAGESGVMTERSDTFEVDPFFTGNPEEMNELGSITHGDATQFAAEHPAGRSGVREFDFQDETGETLELADLSEYKGGDAVMPRPAEISRPSYTSPDFAGLEAPSDGGVVDLPMPSGTARDLDLPLPTDSAPALDLAMPGGVSSDLDLPAPVGSSPDLDLPSPGPGPALDLPTPVGPSPDLELPNPGGMDLSLDDLPMPAADLPTPASELPMALDDFPSPGGDFPAPGGDFPALDLDELPVPADNLPAVADSLPTAADSLPMPVDILPTAADSLPTAADSLPMSADAVDDLDLDGPGSSITSGEFEVDPAEAATIAAPAPRISKLKWTRKGSPSPKGGERNIGRIVLYSVLGLVVVGVGGFVIATQLGLFEPEPDLPPSPDNTNEVLPPPTELAERPDSVLAKFDQDTPASYVQAYTLLENDPVGRAEAALLLHYRYGPDPDKLNEAGQLLADYQESTEPFVRRIIGLALLSTGKVDEALARLEGDDPRTALYRAWALLEDEQLDAAREAAQLAVAARPNDQAAQLAVLEARVAANPVDGIAAMRQALEVSANHLALQEALMRAAHREGLLAEASALGRNIQPTTVSASHKAELLRQRATLAAAQGRTGEAMRLLEQALESDADLLSARLDRIDLWLENKELSSARADLELLLRDHPKDATVLKTAARADLEAGRDDDARQRLATLGEAGAKDAEALDLLGEADALLMKVEAARESYAKARAVDPYYIPAFEHELTLLLRAQMSDAATALLDSHALVLAEANAKSVPRGRKALAALNLARAEVLASQDEPSKALAATEAAITSDPSDNDARLLRAMLLHQLDRTEAHEAALLELHERTGGYPGLTEPLGAVLLAKGQLDELEALISDSLESPSASREILLTGSSLRLAQERHGDALALAKRVIDRDPTDSRAHLLLGRALLGMGDYPRALSEIESAQTREGDAEVELWLGQALEYNGRANEALGHYKRSLELDPRNLEASALLGRLYAYQGGAARAMELLEPVVAETDAYPYAHLALGLAHKDLGKRKLAIKDFQKAQTLDPTLFEAYYEEGRIHNDQNNHKLAARALQAGIDNAKDTATERVLVDAYRRLGESYKRLGRRGDARAALEEYLRMAPANDAGRPAVERLLRDL